MTQRRHSAYLSRLEGSTPDEKVHPSARYSSPHHQDDYSINIPGQNYQSRYLNSDEAREDVRDSPVTQTQFRKRSNNTESRTTTQSSPNRPSYNHIDKFSSDASISTNVLHEAINNALDDVSRIQDINKMMSASRLRANESASRNRTNYDSSNYHDSNRDPSPVREFVSQPSTRPISPLDDQTISNNNQNKVYPKSEYDGESRRGVRPFSNSRSELRSHNNHSHGRNRDDSSTYTSRYPNRSGYSTMTYRRGERESYGRSEYGADDYQGNYSSRIYGNDDRSRLDYSDRNRNYRSSSRGSYFNRLEDRFMRRRDDDYISDDRHRDSSALREDLYYSRKMGSHSHREPVDTFDGSRFRGGSVHSTTRDSLMTFDVVNDGGNIKLRTRDVSPEPQMRADVSIARALYEMNASNFLQKHNVREKEQQPIVINVHTNPPAPPQSASESLMQQSYIGNPPQRGGLPPRMPIQTNVQGIDGVTSHDSDVSSVTGIPKTLHTVKKQPRSIVSNFSGVSKWKSSDVVLLPKGEVKSEAAIAATAAATLIVDEMGTKVSFETAVKSVSNMLKRNKEGDEDAALTVRPSISHRDFFDLTDDSVIPISFHKVTKNMKENMRMKATLKGVGKNDVFKTSIESSDFFARCALLAATAIMKADPIDKAIIAQTAAETILSFYATAKYDDDWLNSAERNLEDVATEVSHAIYALHLPGNQAKAMASLASIAVLSEGRKSLALERVRRRVQPEVEVEVIEENILDKQRNKGDENVDNDDNCMNQIRGKGSLMDDLLDSDDSSDDEKQVKLPPRNNDNKPQGPNPIFSSSTVRKAPSFSMGILRTNTDSAETEKDLHQHLHYDSIEDIKAVNNNLLLSLSSSENMDVRQSQSAAKKSALDKKQDEIANRMLRIQMHAAGKSEEEINHVLGMKRAFGTQNILKSTARNINNEHMMSGFDTNDRREAESDLPSANEIIDSAKELIEDIGTMFAPVISYIGALNMPLMENVKVSSMMEKIPPLERLPQCKVNENGCKFDESNEFKLSVDEIEVLQERKEEATNLEHNLKQNGRCITMDDDAPLAPLPYTLSDYDNDGSGNRNNNSTPQAQQHSVKKFESPHPNNNLDTAQHNHLLNKDEVFRQQGPTSSSRLSSSLSRTATDDSGGAFSDALNKGDFSSNTTSATNTTKNTIPKLSLIPPRNGVSSGDSTKNKKPQQQPATSKATNNYDEINYDEILGKDSKAKTKQKPRRRRFLSRNRG